MVKHFFVAVSAKVADPIGQNSTHLLLPLYDNAKVLVWQFVAVTHDTVTSFAYKSGNDGQSVIHWPLYA